MKSARLLLIMAAMLPLASRMPAQTLDVLHAFTVPNPTNSDGVYPLTVLVLSGGTLYGAASGGGTNNLGTVFSVGTDGSAFTVLHTFNGTNFANAEGARPQGSLILSGNTLYGTCLLYTSTENFSGTGQFKINFVRRHRHDAVLRVCH